MADRNIYSLLPCGFAEGDELVVVVITGRTVVGTLRMQARDKLGQPIALILSVDGEQVTVPWHAVATIEKAGRDTIVA